MSYTSPEFISKINNIKHENHLINIVKKYKGSVHSCLYYCHPKYFTPELIVKLIEENLLDVDEESVLYTDLFNFTFTFRQLIEHLSQHPDDIYYNDILQIINNLKPYVKYDYKSNEEYKYQEDFDYLQKYNEEYFNRDYSQEEKNSKSNVSDFDIDDFSDISDISDIDDIDFDSDDSIFDDISE